MNHLNYHQLYYFYKIAEVKSLAAASKVVLVSVPALSMQLKELEDQVGSVLLDRKGFELTPLGHLVFEYAQKIFKLGKELQDTLNDRSSSLQIKKIEIGCEDSIPKFIQERLIEFLFKEGVKVIVREAPLERLKQMQDNFELDLILTHGRPSNHYDDTRLKKIFSERLILVASPKIYKKVMSKDLEEIPIILNLARPMTALLLDKYWSKINKTPKIIAEIEDHQAEIDLARKGHGVIFTYPLAVAKYLKEKKLIKLYDLAITDEVWLVIGERLTKNELTHKALNEFEVK